MRLIDYLDKGAMLGPDAPCLSMGGMDLSYSDVQRISHRVARALARTGIMHWIWALLIVVWFAPNTQQIMAAARPALGIPPDSATARWQWRPAAASAVVVAAMALAVIVNLNRHSEFLYFQF